MENLVSVLNKSTVIEFCKQYSSGKRQFPKAQLQRADLEEKSLSQVCLKEANLSYSNLKNADLSDADLRESSLIRAELSGANLRRANLAGADLSRANLAIAELKEANLTGACLNKACLISAKLIQVDLSYANLTGTYLMGVDLSKTNLKGSFYNDETNFPSNFDPVSAGMLQECTVEKIIAQFNHLCEYSNRYLGSTMTAKYFHSSRPNFDWLKKFEIDEFDQIIFQGGLKDSISSLQLQWIQKWIYYFIESCSQIIKDFSKLV
ncbi:MAG: pentapeptide repeat-containing protein [Waterburya sp.]